MNTETTKFRHEDYTVAWVCALPLEMAVAKAMLDETHPDLPTTARDNNNYILGRIHFHNVVIACLPSGVYGTNSAATVAAQMLTTFKSIRFGLMVGIGGGVPNNEVIDIRLGDVVVSRPTNAFGGVVQYDFGKTVREGRFEQASVLNKPPQVLLTAVSRLQADHMLDASRITDLLSGMVATYPQMGAKFVYQGQDNDTLFDSTYDHKDSQTNNCDECDRRRIVERPARQGRRPFIHYGLIASGNQVMKHGGTRDKLAKELGILCFEMEAAGLMDSFPCLVIRGICDYADSHKNKRWQEYAAATAAAYTKELLSVIAANHVADTPVASSTNEVRYINPIAFQR